MKRTLLGIAAILAFAFAAGCDDKISQGDLENQRETIEKAKDNVVSEEQQLAAMKERQILETKMDAELTAMDATIKTLEDQAEKAEGDLQVELRKESAGLRTKYDQMKRKLDELKAASGDAWASTKLAAEDAWKDLKDSVQKLVDKQGGSNPPTDKQADDK